MIAKVCRFYGWTVDHVLKMLPQEFYDMFEAITILEAQEMLINMKIADWPNMKDDDRARFADQMQTSAYPDATRKGKKKISNKELFEILSKR